MLKVQPVYHVSPAPSNPLIGLHPGMLTHIPSPGITGTSGQPKNENSYTIKQEGKQIKQDCRRFLEQKREEETEIS